MDNFVSKTPEQKLSTLAAEILTPIHTIKGFAQLLKMDIESNNINSDNLLEKVDRIIEAAEKIRIFRDEAVGS
jgi:nitrogen-specific signal transduction histidine kinase